MVVPLLCLWRLVTVTVVAAIVVIVVVVGQVGEPHLAPGPLEIGHDVRFTAPATKYAYYC